MTKLCFFGKGQDEEMQRSQRVIAVLLSALLMFVPGSTLSAQSKTQTSESTAKGAGSKNESDASLEQAIRKRFAASKIGANGFTVQVTNGIATLRGQAEVPQHKGVATRLARLAGAKDVVNQIVITDAGKRKLQQMREKKAAPKTSQQSRPQEQSAQKEVASGEDLAGNMEGAKESAGESSQLNTAGAIPRFKIVSPARRGEARSERRRY
jgi:osmotically-inducible protein OsmY